MNFIMEMLTRITAKKKQDNVEESQSSVVCKKWFFGHYHQDKIIDENYVAIFNSIYKI